METLLTIIGVLCIIASAVLGISSSFSLDKEEFFLELMQTLLKWGLGFILMGILICLF